jgi:hypothetical protein
MTQRKWVPAFAGTTRDFRMPKKYTPRIDERWIRHDWRMWIRPDIARWIKPGVDPADVIPGLARERAQQQAAKERARAAEDAELAAEIEHERRVLAALSEEMKEVHAEMARRRRRLADEAKYSPSQPRVPAGDPRGGRWTDRNEGGSGFGGLDSANPGSADATGDAEDAGANSYDATPSTDAASSGQSEGDGTRGYDDRLAASDKPSPGRAAMLGIMARAAEGLIKLYRSENLLLDLFGNKSGAIAVTTMDDKDIYGSNSTSLSTYKDADFKAARELRDRLVEKYPTIMSVDKLGEAPNNALFHAETNVLLRAAETNGGTLAGRSLDIYVDRAFCSNCQVVIPLVGLELGNPTLTYVDPDRIYSIANGKITSRSKR